jgi:hypothetical protein
MRGLRPCNPNRVNIWIFPSFQKLGSWSTWRTSFSQDRLLYSYLHLPLCWNRIMLFHHILMHTILRTCTGVAPPTDSRWTCISDVSQRSCNSELVYPELQLRLDSTELQLWSHLTEVATPYSSHRSCNSVFISTELQLRTRLSGVATPYLSHRSCNSRIVWTELQLRIGLTGVATPD